MRVTITSVRRLHFDGDYPLRREWRSQSFEAEPTLAMLVVLVLPLLWTRALVWLFRRDQPVAADGARARSACKACETGRARESRARAATATPSAK